MKELRLGDWDGKSGRALFWCADFESPPTLINPRLWFDKEKVVFERIKPEILCDGEVVGKILVFRIKEIGCTCVIESERISQTVLPGGYRHPTMDDPHVDVKYYYHFVSHMENGVEVIDYLAIDKEFFSRYEIEDD